MEAWIVNGVTWLAFYIAGYVVSHKKSKTQVESLEKKISKYDQIEQRERAVKAKENNNALYETNVQLQAQYQVTETLQDALRSRS